METETLDVAGKKLSLVEAFADLPDPRVVGRSKHDLMEMLVVAVCALVCGVSTVNYLDGICRVFDHAA